MKWLTYVAAFALAVAIGGVHAQDLTVEWLSVRAAGQGLPMTVDTADLADIYGATDRRPGFFQDQPDTNTPAQMLIDLPLLLVPYEAIPAAAVVFGFVTALGFGVAARLMWWMPLILFSYPGIENLRHGQFGFMLAALLAWTLTMKDDRYLAGLPLGLAVAMKVNLWFMIPVLYLAGKRRTAVGGVGMVVGSNLLGLLLLPGVTLSGLWDLAQTVGSNQAASGWNGSLVGALGLPWWVAILLGLVLLVPVSLSQEPLRLAIPLTLLVAPITLYVYLPVLLIGASRNAIVSLLVWWAVPWVYPIDAGLLVLVSILISLAWVIANPLTRSSPTDQTHTHADTRTSR